MATSSDPANSQSDGGGHADRWPRLTSGGGGRRALAVTAVATLLVTGAAIADHDGSGPTVAAAPAPGPPSAPAAPAGPPAVFTGADTPTPPRPATRRPNILLVTADDASVTDLRQMPNVRRQLVRQGVRFAEGVAPTPICVPARASLLTGQFAHNHGAYTIDGPDGGVAAFDDRRTLPVALQRAGYDTLFTGKYLNHYGEGRWLRYVPPGWTDWRGTGPGTYDFFNPVLNVNGALRPQHRYTTYVMRDQANAMMRAPRRQHRPWFLWVNYVAPHHGSPSEPGDPRLRYRGDPFPTTVPAPADRGRFARARLPGGPALFEPDTRDKARRSAVQERFRPAIKRALRVANQQRLESLQAVDRAVASHLRVLRRTHQLSTTQVWFTSDNGFVVGAHNLYGKLWHYDDIIRIPVVARGPGIPRGQVVRTPVSNPDIAATVLATAGARPLRPVDGVDILPWLRSPAQQRVMPIEAWPLAGTRRLYAGVRVGPWTYVRLFDGEEELFNRDLDPHELRSVAHERRFRPQLRALRKLTREYRDCRGRTCPREFRPAFG